MTVAGVDSDRHPPDLPAPSHDPYVSAEGDVEHQTLEGEMGVSHGLVALGVPVRVNILGVPEILANSDKILPQLQSMLVPVSKDIECPSVGPALLPVDHPHPHYQLRFIGIILDNLDNLGLGYVLILDLQDPLNLLLHALGNQVKSLDLRHQLYQLFLQLNPLLLYQQLFDPVCIFGPFIQLQFVLAYNVLVMTYYRLDLELALHLLLLAF